MFYFYEQPIALLEGGQAQTMWGQFAIEITELAREGTVRPSSVNQMQQGSLRGPADHLCSIGKLDAAALSSLMQHTGTQPIFGGREGELLLIEPQSTGRILIGDLEAAHLDLPGAGWRPGICAMASSDSFGLIGVHGGPSRDRSGPACGSPRRVACTSNKHVSALGRFVPSE